MVCLLHLTCNFTWPVMEQSFLGSDWGSTQITPLWSFTFPWRRGAQEATVPFTNHSRFLAPVLGPVACSSERSAGERPEFLPEALMGVISWSDSPIDQNLFKLWPSVSMISFFLFHTHFASYWFFGFFFLLFKLAVLICKCFILDTGDHFGDLFPNKCIRWCAMYWCLTAFRGKGGDGKSSLLTSGQIPGSSVWKTADC